MDSPTPSPTPAHDPSRQAALRAQLARHYRHLYWARASLVLVLGLVGSGTFVLLREEAQTSTHQSQWLSEQAARLQFQVEPGASAAIHWPSHGPFDQRLGYTALPDFIQRLEAQGYQIERQARFSTALLDYTRLGLYPPYREKIQAGLTISDCRGTPIFTARYPQRTFATFEQLPPLLINSLLFIENRDLLDAERAFLNPAVDWPRFLHAAWSQLAQRLDAERDTAGGSTLATQIEKFRHSPGGRTPDAAEKLRQMLSASLRAYREGRETLPVRQQLVLDYLNTVPLAAAPGHGEVHGFADGLWVWFAVSPAAHLRALRGGADIGIAEQGLALRRTLALLIAQRRPSWYLNQGRSALLQLTDSHLRVLATHRVISPALRDAALTQPLVFRDLLSNPPSTTVDSDKGLTAVRTRLVRQLDRPLYAVDRLDLAVTTTLDQPLQQAVSRYLEQLGEADFAAQAGLLGERMLSPQLVGEVQYSFTLFERRDGANRVRVQTDTSGQPFDLNEGSKLELGSTAKLRVMATYLEVIGELHRQHAGRPPSELRRARGEARDNLSRWLLDHLLASPEASLTDTLDAALERRYSASPNEVFFTGGGAHTFNNFRREDNGRRPTLREALRESINLPFVRLLRDLVRYSAQHMPGNSTALLADDRHPDRQLYLQRFADREGTVFLQRFWRKYRNLPPEAMLDTLLGGLRPSTVRLAAIHRYLFPEADFATFSAFLHQRLGAGAGSEATQQRLYQRYAPGNFDLPDQGYLARVHPLELWLIGYRLQHPQADFATLREASQDERQAVYAWLFKTRHRGARDSRIRTLIEVEAFLDLQQRWARLGFPFEHMVPSLASALGSSGDRPAALAELMGIILNDGRRLPTVRLDSLHFAADTPYETYLRARSAQGEPVMLPEVAAALRGVLGEVVDNGTARRLRGQLLDEHGQALAIGGKTGTGDNRLDTVARNGQVIRSQVRNRTATFVFFLGERHFGTLTAHVPGEQAAGYRFTSALPVQALKGLLPILHPALLDAAGCTPPPSSAAAPQAATP